MNELLFRAWDTLTKKWIAKDFTILGEVTCFDIIGQYLRDNLCGKETTLARLEDVIIQQWTSRYDDTKWNELTEKERENWTVEGNMPSNWKGIRIYEGDIIKSWSSHYLIEYDNENCAYIARWIDDGGLTNLKNSFDTLSNKITVIGNDCFNPELLNQ